jgi:hypothetical protein
MDQELRNTSEPQLIDFATIADGALIEAFGLKLQEVLANIQDPNTPATAKREITLTLSLHPKDDRTQIDTAFTCKARLASLIPATSRIFMGRDDDGNLYALDRDPRQQNLFNPPKPAAMPAPLTFKTAN